MSYHTETFYDETDVTGSTTHQNPTISASVVESGPSAEGSSIDETKVALVDVDPPTSVPPIPRIGEPDST